MNEIFTMDVKEIYTFLRILFDRIFPSFDLLRGEFDYERKVSTIPRCPFYLTG